MGHRIMKAAPVAFVAVVIVSNMLTNTLGVVDWLGITATAGTWVAGFAFVARDAVQESHGTRAVVVCILAGAILSALFSPSLALASGVAFLVSELADFAVYQPLRRRRRLLAALASNLAGSIVDTLLFLTLAGFPLNLAGAQVGIKYATTSTLVLVLWGIRALFRQPDHAASRRSHD